MLLRDLIGIEVPQPLHSSKHHDNMVLDTAAMLDEQAFSLRAEWGQNGICILAGSCFFLVLPNTQAKRQPQPQAWGNFQIVPGPNSDAISLSDTFLDHQGEQKATEGE